MESLLTLPALALVIGVVLVLVALLMLELLAVRRIGSIMSPALEYARAKAEEEAEHILATARENARALITRAEAAAAAVAADRSKEDEAARHAHEEALRAARAGFEAILADVTKAAQSAGEESKDALAKEIAALGADAKKEFKAATDTSVKAFNDEMQATLAAAREGATHYEEARREAVDAHIREIVTETTKLALAMSLPEAATAELVLKAFEEAKATHAF